MDSISTRESLLLRLKDWDDAPSWQEFFDLYWRLIYNVALRAGLSATEAQDIVQETVLSVAKKIKEFEYDPKVGSFKSWLMTVIQRRISDHFRKGKYQSAGQKKPRELAVDPAELSTIADRARHDVEQAWDTEWQAQIMEVVMERVRLQISPKQFQIFDLHVRKGLSAREVGKRLNLTLAQVYFAKYKVSGLVKKLFQRLEREGH